MPKIIIVAPEGATKDINTEALAKHLGCTEVINNWNGETPLQDGQLAITAVDSAYYDCASTTVYTLEEALTATAAAHKKANRHCPYPYCHGPEIREVYSSNYINCHCMTACRVRGYKLPEWPPRADLPLKRIARQVLKRALDWLDQ